MPFIAALWASLNQGAEITGVLRRAINANDLGADCLGVSRPKTAEAYGGLTKIDSLGIEVEERIFELKLEFIRLQVAKSRPWIGRKFGRRWTKGRFAGDRIDGSGGVEVTIEVALQLSVSVMASWGQGVGGVPRRGPRSWDLAFHWFCILVVLINIHSLGEGLVMEMVNVNEHSSILVGHFLSLFVGNFPLLFVIGYFDDLVCCLLSRTWTAFVPLKIWLGLAKGARGSGHVAEASG
jgi:hypothetical protein